MKYLNIKRYETTLPDIASSKCEQVAKLVDQENALICMFDTQKLESVCKKHIRYEGTNDFKITSLTD